MTENMLTGMYSINTSKHNKNFDKIKIIFTCDQYMYEIFTHFFVIKTVAVFYHQNENHTCTCFCMCI